MTIEFDVNNANNVNIQPLSSTNNPQAGSLAPQAFKDINLNTTADPDAVSGYNHRLRGQANILVPSFPLWMAPWFASSDLPLGLSRLNLIAFTDLFSLLNFKFAFYCSSDHSVVPLV